MKKPIFLCLLFAVFLMPAAFAGKTEFYASGNYAYALAEDDTAVIVYYKGKDTELFIPDTLDGHAVIGIMNAAFSFCDSVVSVTIPDGMLFIDENSFEGCKNLTSVTIPGSVEVIEDNAFLDCDSLTQMIIHISAEDHALSEEYAEKYTVTYCTPDGMAYILLDDDNARITDYNGNEEDVWIPGSLALERSHTTSYWSRLESFRITSIGDYAFEGCDFMNSIVIPPNVTSIGDHAFSRCVSLAEITIPDGVTAIGDATFFSCSALSSVGIPDSVESMGTNPFAFCTELSEIRISPSNNGFTMLDGVVFDKDMHRLICYPCSFPAQSYVVPEGVLVIDDAAFYRCFRLNFISIPDSVTSIGDEAFWHCEFLSEITIGSSVSSIGEKAFSGCYFLTEIRLPDSVTSIGSHAFSGCRSLASVSIPKSVTSIGEDAFRGCNQITLIVEKDSYAESWADENDVPYEFTDSADWLLE